MQEISLNILDVAENSVKAKASLVEITVSEQPAVDRLTVMIRDNGCGMNEEQLTRVTDPFFTSRTTRKVGLGIPFLKMAAEMTGGSLDMTSTPGVGTTVKATFGYHHIDRMPLGNLVDTVCTLVQCNPDIDFLYTHQYGKEKYVMDTREFRAVLGDVPLNTPDVIAYLRDYLREGDRDLQHDAPQN